MTIFVLMIMVLLVTRVFSGMAEGPKWVRNQWAPPAFPPTDGQFNDYPQSSAAPLPAMAPLPYGYLQTAWGLPTDVPLSTASRNAIDSDITHFGIELRELDFDVVGYELTDEARGDYTKALDAY